MTSYIRKFRREDEYYFKEGCYIVEVSNSEADSAASIAHARVTSGQSTKWHWLSDTFERYVIIRGQGRVEVGESDPVDVQPADVVLIPPGTRQRITNTGEDDLEFLAICTPRFESQNYHSQDEHDD